MTFIRKISLAMSEPPLVNIDGASFELFIKEGKKMHWMIG